MNVAAAYEITRLSHAQKPESCLGATSRMLRPTAVSTSDGSVEALLTAAEEEACNRATN